MSLDTVWLTSERAAVHLGYGADAKAVHAFREWIRGQAIVPCRRGRRLLYHRADLDRLVGDAQRRQAMRRLEQRPA